MSIFTDMKIETYGNTVTRTIKTYLSPREWLRLHSYRVQRANRGWSDRDLWGAGDHIAQMTAEMLLELEKGHVDWPEWFKLNVAEEGKGAYKSLSQVYVDIINYLDFEKTTWGDDLTSVPKEKGKFSHDWVYPNGKIATDADITHRINKWHAEQTRLYKKAQKAMCFFGRHFTQFWD